MIIIESGMKASPSCVLLVKAENFKDWGNGRLELWIWW